MCFIRFIRYCLVSVANREIQPERQRLVSPVRSSSGALQPPVTYPVVSEPERHFFSEHEQMNAVSGKRTDTGAVIHASLNDYFFYNCSHARNTLSLLLCLRRCHGCVAVLSAQQDFTLRALPKAED